MKEDTLKKELQNSGYSKEEQFFYELNLQLKNKLIEESQELRKSKLKPPKS